MLPSSNKLQVYLLGAFHLEFKSQLIHLPTRKVESLLAYLILYPTVHTREKLAALFWGDSSESAARGSLRKALTLLRKHIDPEIVFADRENIQLTLSFPIWVDAIEFQGQASEFLAGSLSHAIPTDFYQGDLLRDFYDDWIMPLREHYRALHLDVLLHAVGQSRAQSNYELAIEYAKKILIIDPTSEHAHQHLMFCYITLGDRNKALHQYEICHDVLQDELGVEPTRETQALYHWIKQSVPGIPSLAARITNLPIPISSFVGRNKELAKVKQLLSSARLVTLTGAGGSGKTRLAIHAATDLIDAFKDGVWWVELAQLTDPSLVPSAVAKALGLDGRSDRPMTESLKKFLHTKNALLVLDNCEHLIDACARLSEILLTSCAGIKILATSRETLSLTGEHVWPVPTLSLPNVQNITLIDLLMQYEGIRLFAERAVAINPDFTPNDENALAIAQVCQRLDGIPLAIELAAARIKTMSIGEISDGLDDRFQLLTAQNRTVQTRHQTLRAAVDWSYELLTVNEKKLFCRLSVFSGGWTLEAAESVCSGEGIEEKEIPNLLARLTDKSLITSRADGQRYYVLETMRQYGKEKLIQTGNQGQILQEYLDYYLNMAGMGDEMVRGSEQDKWHNWFQSEQDNLADALEKALGSPSTLEKGCSLVCAMCWHWGMIGDFVTMKHWLKISLQQSADLGNTPTRAKVLFNAGSFSVWGLNWLEASDALMLIYESLEIWNELLPKFILQRAQCLLTLGYIQKIYFNDNKGFEYLNESIAVFQESNNFWWHAWALNLLAMMMDDSKDIETIKKILEEENTLWEKSGGQWGKANPLFDLGSMEFEKGNFLEAEKYLRESLRIFSEIGSKGYIIQLQPKLGDVARGLKQYDQAKTYYEDSVPLAAAIMWDASLAQIYFGLGYVALSENDTQQADEYFKQSLKVSQKFELHRRRILCIAGFASVAVLRGDALFAARLFGSFFAQLESLESELNTNQESLNPVDKTEIDEYLATSKSQIGKLEFEIAWNQGASLSLDDVLGEILKVSE